MVVHESLLDNLLLNEWAGYFNIKDDKFIAEKSSLVLDDLWKRPGTNIYSLTDDEKLLLNKLYKQYLIKCDTDLSTDVYCKAATTASYLLGILREPYDTLELADRYHKGTLIKSFEKT